MIKEIVLDVEYTPLSAQDEGDVEARWDAVMHDLGDHGWVTDDTSTPYENGAGFLTISAALSKDIDVTADQSCVLTLVTDLCPDIRIVGGGLTTSTKEGG